MARMHASLLALVAVGAMAVGDAALGQDKKTRVGKANQVLIEYVVPKDPKHRRTYERLKERRVLEQFQEFLSPIRLPTPLTLKFMGCDGDSNAWYQRSDHSVTVCYEYIEEAIQNAPKHTTPDGVSHEDAILGPGIEVFLHEVGHAIFDMLKFPVLGRAEDAADQFAAYKLLHLGKEEAHKTIAGVAFMYVHDAKEERSAGALNFSDEHGLAVQRYYNLLCIAYGNDPQLFQKFVDKKHLPAERAKRCAGEYRQVAFAIRTLMRPYVDRKVALKVKTHQHWMQLALD